MRHREHGPPCAVHRRHVPAYIGNFFGPGSGPDAIGLARDVEYLITA